MTANDYQKYAIIGYRIPDPELATWSRLLDLRTALRERAIKQLNLQIDMMLESNDVQQEIRKHLQVSSRHSLSRREVFNWIIKQHDENAWAFNWKLVIEVLPYQDIILIKLECGAITCTWFKEHARFEQFDDIESIHVNKDADPGSYTFCFWNQPSIPVEGYRLVVIDQLEEYAQLCV